MAQRPRLPRTSPRAGGVDPAAIDALAEALDKIGEVHALVIVRHGAVVAEGAWAPYAPDQRHQMFSVSKAFTAMAVGIAAAEGLLSVEDRVVDLLPDAVPAMVSENLAAMRVEHLLTMTTGHALSSMEGRGRTIGRREPDWARAILAEDVPLVPGSRFVYDTGATYLLSAILHRLTGMRLLDYLTPRLLRPLGIVGAEWEQDHEGIDVGGYGLSLTTEDMAAFGQLMLQRGRWGDTQLVPAEWIARASDRLVDSAPQGWDPDWAQGYGYQLWRCRVDAVRADGAFGQFIIVWPEHDAVIAITSGTSRTQAVLDSVWNSLRGAFADPGGSGDPSAAAPDAAALAVRRTRAMPQGRARSDVEAELGGVEYALSWDEPAGAPSFAAAALSTERQGDRLVLRLRADDGAALELRAAHGQWLASTGPGGEPLAASYAWSDPQQLVMTVLGIGTPFTWTLAARFDERAVRLTMRQNVAFDGSTQWQAEGRRVEGRRDTAPAGG
ncbi:serine hydrolase [Microbacterium sp. NPDC096154]|uniref:serine hydrolase domain-containing protein n=1 Tax=Microbacterium sp. NPDC096154 TaxID=3155549 RepID=UPI003326BE60